MHWIMRPIEMVGPRIGETTRDNVYLIGDHSLHSHLHESATRGMHLLERKMEQSGLCCCCRQVIAIGLRVIGARDSTFPF